MLNKIRSFITNHKTILTALAVYVGIHALDFVSTACVAAYVGGLEGNPLARTVPGHFPMFDMLWYLKGIGTGLLGMLSAGIYLGTDSETLASVPFYFMAFETASAVLGNFGLVIRVLHG